MQCRIVKLKDMNNRLHTYFDRTRLERIDYFRQLIFLAFTSLSIVLFGLHLVGSYGLAIKSALACSACYVVAAAVAFIVYLFQGPKKLKHILPVLLVTLMIIQSVRLLVLASMGQLDAMLTTVNITDCFILVLVACLCLLPPLRLSAPASAWWQWLYAAVSPAASCIASCSSSLACQMSLPQSLSSWPTSC